MSGHLSPNKAIKDGFFWTVLKKLIDLLSGSQPASQALTVRTVIIVTPISMTTVKIASIKTGVRKHKEIQRSQSRWWRFVDVDYFIIINVHAQSPMSMKISPKACTLVACGQTLQGHASCLKKTLLVGSLVVPTSLHQCSGSPVVE